MSFFIADDRDHLRGHVNVALKLQGTKAVELVNIHISSYACCVTMETTRKQEALQKGLSKLNMWLTTPKGATPVNYTSATDWQMAVRRDVISITIRQV